MSQEPISRLPTREIEQGASHQTATSHNEGELDPLDAHVHTITLRHTGVEPLEYSRERVLLQQRMLRHLDDKHIALKALQREVYQAIAPRMSDKGDDQ